MARPLTDFTDDELKAELSRKADNVVYSYDDMVAEIDRRSRNRDADATRRTATTALWIAVAGVIVSVVATVLTYLRPS